jgi:hypothetical protein
MAQGRRVSPTGCAIVILFWPFLIWWALIDMSIKAVWGDKRVVAPPTKAQVQDVAKAYRDAKKLIEIRLKVLRREDGKRGDQGHRGLPQETHEAGSQKEDV